MKQLYVMMKHAETRCISLLQQNKRNRFCTSDKLNETQSHEGRDLVLIKKTIKI